MRRIKALIDGTWHGCLDETPEVREVLSRAAGQRFSGRVAADPDSEHPAEPGRYHLYVSYACPWAHRTIIYRRLKCLDDVVSMSVLHPRWAGPNGWRFEDGPLGTADHAGGRTFLHEVYRDARPDYTGRVTVPVLWDKRASTIVNNESGEIIRFLNTAFDRWGDDSVDFYPRDLRAEIEAVNSWILPSVCRGVYAAGFAATQAGHESAVRQLFDSLDRLERRLESQPYLCGDVVTESDWHLFATLCRFDAVYFGAMKCNVRRLTDYPELTAYTRRLHEMPGVGETVRIDHVMQHYYDAIDEIDRRIVPIGPAIDYRSARSAVGGAVS